MAAASSLEERIETRQDWYYEAALPSEEVGLEFTFEMFFADYFGKHDAALRDDMTDEGIAILREASIREQKARKEDSETFGRLIDFVAHQIGADQHDAAGPFIAQAFNDLYQRRRARYQDVIDRLTVPDQAALDRHFFGQLSIDKGRVPPQQKHWATRFVLELPQMNPCRLERHSVYMLPHGLPMKKIRCIALEAPDASAPIHVLKTASMTEYSTRGD